MRDSEGSTELHVACVAQEDEAGGQKGVALALDPKGCGGGSREAHLVQEEGRGEGRGLPSTTVQVLRLLLLILSAWLFGAKS